jgi:hypothetical protein
MDEARQDGWLQAIAQFQAGVRKASQGAEEIERQLREGVIESMEPILAGTSYWGRAEAEFANQISAEGNPKRRKEMIGRYKELAVQLKDLSSTEREQILLEEIAKWRREAQEPEL